MLDTHYTQPCGKGELVCEQENVVGLCLIINERNFLSLISRNFSILPPLWIVCLFLSGVKGLKVFWCVVWLIVFGYSEFD